MRIHDDKILTVIARLSMNPDFQVFMDELVKKPYQEALEKCVSEDIPARHQGCAQGLNELITTVDGAREAHRSRSTHGINMGNSL